MAWKSETSHASKYKIADTRATLSTKTKGKTNGKACNRKLVYQDLEKQAIVEWSCQIKW